MTLRPDTTSGIARATELTRAGKLHEATALIQSLLGATPQSPPAADDVIDGDFTRIDTPAPLTAGARRAAAAPRSGLAATLRTIAAGGMQGSALPHRRRQPDVPQGAQFLTLTHSGPHGSRDLRLYIPSSHPGGPLPLLVMLHGCTQSPEDFAIGTGMNALAEEFHCLIAYPAQAAGANAQKCWNWFRPEDQTRGTGEAALIAGMVGQILRDHGGDAARVYIAGLSAGGAAAASIADAYPDVFSAAASHSGLPVGAARDIASAFGAMRTGASGSDRRSAVPVIVFQGQADTTVHPANGTALVRQTLATLPGLTVKQTKGRVARGRAWRNTSHHASDGRSMVEFWQVEGAGHAWSGGTSQGSYTDPTGPDASAQILRFFLQHHRG